MAVHIDAVLETRYYTIQLPDGQTKQTNWENLMTLAEYRKRIAICNGMCYEQERSSSRDGGRRNSRSSLRGPSGGARQLGRSRSSSSFLGDDVDGSERASRRAAPRPSSRPRRPSSRGDERRRSRSRDDSHRLRSPSRGVSGPRSPSPQRSPSPAGPRPQRCVSSRRAGRRYVQEGDTVIM